MKTINIGGVPEHFNYPWYLTLKNKEYQKRDINLRWKDFHGGTGAMNAALRSGEIDLAVILAEGIIKDIIDGNNSKIIQVFVESPLIWGIHVAENSEYDSVEELRGKKAAISRFGSGSHLMAYINAENHNWDLATDLDFEVIKNLDGAIEGLTSGQADYFMWEKFTTKPLVDRGVFRRIAECPTPWPCFVIAVNHDFYLNNTDHVKDILEIINLQTAVFKDIVEIDKTISQRYDQQLEDVRQWFSLTEWSQENIKESTVMNIQNSLFKLRIIDKKIDPREIILNT